MSCKRKDLMKGKNGTKISFYITFSFKKSILNLQLLKSLVFNIIENSILKVLHSFDMNSTCYVSFIRFEYNFLNMSFGRLERKLFETFSLKDRKA